MALKFKFGWCNRPWVSDCLLQQGWGIDERAGKKSQHQRQKSQLRWKEFDGRALHILVCYVCSRSKRVLSSLCFWFICDNVCYCLTDWLSDSVNECVNDWMSLSQSGLCGHSYKLYKPNFRLDIWTFSFSVHVINIWNALRYSVLQCNTVSTFKRHLDLYLKNWGYL